MISMKHNLQGNRGIINLPLDNTAVITMERNSTATMLVHPETTKGTIKLFVDNGAGVHVVVPKVEGLRKLSAEVAQGAQCTISLIGNLTDSQEASLILKLIGEGASVHVQMAIVGNGVAQAELKCVMEHISQGTTGRITARRVQFGSSQSSLAGMLRVDAGAVGTDTYLSDKVVLVGEEAKATSDPQLEILADDVQASHGATIGKLSEEELFYLRSRGLDQQQAIRLSLQAFLAPALIGVPQNMAETLLPLV